MSLLKFKCHECGHNIYKTRGLKDIVFDINDNRVLICKYCGCKYKIPKKVNRIIDFYFLLGFVFPIVCFIMVFFTAYRLSFMVDDFNDFFDTKLNGIHILLISFIFFVLVYIVGTFVFVSMFPLEKIEEKE